MRRKHLGLWTAALLLGMWGLLEAQPGGLIDPPTASWLQISPRGQAKNPPVWFSHSRHEQQGVACRQCHHNYRGGRNVWQQGQPVQTCGTCHRDLPQGRRPDLKQAFHRQCKGCHLKLRERQRRAGPVHCQECHRPG